MALREKNRGRGAADAPALVRLSPAARYAVSAASRLAGRRPGEFRAVEDIVEGRGLPRSFVAKLLQRLAQEGIIVSRRGPRGGHALARPAGKISLAEVVAAVEPSDPRRRRCLLELRGCGGGSPCAIHETVVRAEREVWECLRGATLERHARDAGRRGS